MQVPRLTFISHFVLVLAISNGAFFAYQAGIPQMVAANDVARWFGGAIGALFVWTAIWLGWQAWLTDSDPYCGTDEHGAYEEGPGSRSDASFGHLVELLCPAIGMLGTVVGLSLAFKDAGSSAMFAGARTAFFSTGAGIIAMILTMAMTYSLECGIRRARR